MRNSGLVWLAFSIAMLVSASLPALEPGLVVEVKPGSDSDSVLVSIAWPAGAADTRLAAFSPGAHPVELSRYGLLEPADEVHLGPATPGETRVVEIAWPESDEVNLALTRTEGDVDLQTVAVIRRIAGTASLVDVRHYEIAQVEDPDFPGSAVVRIMPLAPKLQAVAFGEDTANTAIPDATGAVDECADNNPVWAVQRRIYFSSAPAAATADQIAVHVMITHPNMSHLQIGFFEETSNTGYFLWRFGGGVNLDQVFTQSMFGQDLPGTGQDVNGWYQLNIRDCTIGTTGTLTYWSVEVTYDDPNAIDLVADSVSVSPDPVEPGGTLNVEWSGEVTGSGTVSGPFTVGLYLSQDTNITTGDDLLASVNVNSAVNPGDTFGDGAPGRAVTIPGGTAEGTWYVGIIVDSANSVTETNDSNNVAWDSVVVEEADAEVDLVADSITPQSGSAAPGGSVLVNWFGHVAGSSTGPAPNNYSVGFYLSPDASITTADTLLDRKTVTALDPGDSFGTSGTSLTIPGGTASGSWFLGMIVDDTGAVTETDENNNVASNTFTVTGGAGQPDLQFVSCDVTPTSVEPGDGLTIEWQATNAGTATAPASTVSAFWSTDQDWDSGVDTWLDSGGISDWAPGNVGSERTFSATVPPDAVSGTAYVLVVLDVHDDADESNEGNNTCVTAVDVTGGEPAATTHWLIPAAASAEGAGSSDWRSQTTVVNQSGSPVNATYYYVASGQAWPGTLLRGPVPLAASQADFLEDPLGTLRPTSGLIHVELDQPGAVVTSRTYNLSPGGATFGQGIPAIPLTGGASPNSLVLPMVHSDDGRYRTNLGLVMADAGTLTVRVDIYTASGLLLSSTTRSQSTAWVQINDLFGKVGLGSSSVDGGWIRVTKTGGSADTWTCYASVVDDVTDDPTYVGPVVP